MGIIQSLIPIMTLILSIIFLRHVTNFGSVLGIVLSAIGVVIVVSRGDLLSLLQHGINLGDMLMLIAALAFALYGFFVHKWKLEIPLLQSVYIQSIVATIVLLPMFIASPKSNLSVESIFYIGFAGLVASILAPLVWMHGILKIGAARASLFFNLLPVITAIFASFFVYEQLTVSILIGGGLTIMGVIIAEFLRSKTELIVK